MFTGIAGITAGALTGMALATVGSVESESCPGRVEDRVGATAIALATRGSGVWEGASSAILFRWLALLSSFDPAILPSWS